MTNAELIAYQRAAKAHREALPGVLEAARRAIADSTGAPLPDVHTAPLSVFQVRTLLREVERLQGQIKTHNDELREAERSARDAYQEGRYDEREAQGERW